MDLVKYDKSQYAADVKADVLALESLRRNANNPKDVNFPEFVKLKYGVSMESYYSEMGVDPCMDTMSNLFTTPDEGFRWLVPEIIREALRLGLRKAPIYGSIIAAEQTITQLSITMPHINMSDATPKYVGEAETISLGNISYGQKTLKVRKMGRGIKIPYEVKQYVALNVVSIFLQDMGVKLGQGIDSLLIDCLLNGEQADGSESAPVVGITTIGTIVYKDILKVWLRMSRMGKNPTAMIGGEDMALAVLDLPEFKDKHVGTPLVSLNVKTPIPVKSDFFIHGAMPANQLLVIDPSSTVIKYNAQPLLVESEKIVSNQTEATYATLTTGFGIVYRDSRVVIDKSLAFASQGFPSYMDVSALEQVTITE